MPAKKAGKAKAGPQINPTSSFTPENFEKELKDLAQKAKNESPYRTLKDQTLMYTKCATILLLIAVYSNVSQLALSPAYGSIPSSIVHSKVVMLACFAGWSSNLVLGRYLPFRPIKLLPFIALYIPTVQFILGFYTRQLRTEWGPLVTELLTLFPLMVVSVAVVATSMETADFSFLPSWLGDAMPGFASYAFFKSAENIVAQKLPAYVGQTFFQTRMGLEILLAGCYTIMAPSKLLIFALPALFHTAFYNTHVMTSMGTSQLRTQYGIQNWALLDRAESLTGYVSVIENKEASFRVLRCDHSLLGGEWTNFPITKVAEPVYGVFAMLEAVRLVETPEPIVDSEANALVIGLGVGTTPAAFVMHGITTTVVEIDPVVHDFASKYFHLPSNHTIVIEDAVGYASNMAAAAVVTPAFRYDYIVHDVFTGGAEPVDLFTLEFLTDLSALLKENGVIAINYAGDFLLPSPALVVRTVKTVFPTCRIFRESARETDEQLAAHGRGDFTNMVIFCTKTKGGELAFRKAVEGDYLDSKAREMFLVPQHEVNAEDIYGVKGDDGAIVRKNETARLSVWHEQSAVGHWKVMRTVIPAKIWEMW